MFLKPSNIGPWIEKILFKSSVVALLEQARIDRDNGKTLCSKMDKMVNIYSKILTDYPAPKTPVTQGVAQ